MLRYFEGASGFDRKLGKKPAEARFRMNGGKPHPIIEPMEPRTLLSAGSLDTTFGSGDSVLIPETGGAEAYGAAVAVQPNGDIDLLTTPPSAKPGAALPQLQVRRLRPNGALDTTFGTQGVATISATSPSAPGELIIQPNGLILIVSGKTMARLTIAGALDTTFAAAKGVESLAVSATSAALQADGKIDVLGGTSVYRFNTNGALDTTYGVNGVASVGSTGFTSSGGIALDSSGRAVVSMADTMGTGDMLGQFEVERLTTTGHVDTTFGVQGFVKDLAQPDDAGSSTVAIAPSGTIYVAENYDQFEGDDMSLLSAFTSTGGHLTNSVQSFDGGIFSLTVGPDNKLLAAGYEFDGAGGNNADVVVERFLRNSFQLDSTFNGTGTRTISYSTGDDNRDGGDYGDFGWSVAMQPDAKIVVAGSTFNITSGNVTTNEFTVARLTNDITAGNGVIGGTIYNDANQNRAFDGAEKGLAGWTVYLDLQNYGVYSAGDPVTTTNASGQYSFAGLSAGTWIVRATPPSGWQQTSPINPYGLHVTLGLDGTASGANIGFHNGPLNFVVNTTADSTDALNSTTVSLRDAINEADEAVGPVNITFSPTVFNTNKTIQLASAIPDLASNHYGAITVTGPAGGVTIKSHLVDIIGGHGETLPTGNEFTVDAGISAGFSNITFLQLGFHNAGALTLINTTITGNPAVGDGGAILNTGALTLRNSTISGNSAMQDPNPEGYYGGHGGGIENDGTMTIVNSTIAGNSADYGAGAGIDNHGTATITNSTVSGNDGGGIDNAPPSGSSHPKVTLANTIVAGNTGTDVTGAFTSSGHNLIGAKDGSSGWTTSDLTGTAAHPLSAKLSPLGNYGGLTQTFVPLAGSPAIEAGAVGLIPTGVTTDQRGLPRTVGGKIDIGSVEIDKGGPFTGTPAPFGLIQAENFDFGGQNVAYFNPTSNTNAGGQYRPNEGISISTIPAASGGGLDVGNTHPGQWMDYTVTVAATGTGTYTLNFRVASGVAGNGFQLNVDGVNVTGKLAIPNDGWNTYVTVSKAGVHLTAGTHVLRLLIDSSNATGGSGNFDWFDAVKTS